MAGLLRATSSIGGVNLSAGGVGDHVADRRRRWLPWRDGRRREPPPPAGDRRRAAVGGVGRAPGDRHRAGLPPRAGDVLHAVRGGGVGAAAGAWRCAPGPERPALLSAGSGAVARGAVLRPGGSAGSAPPPGRRTTPGRDREPAARGWCPPAPVRRPGPAARRRRALRAGAHPARRDRRCARPASRTLLPWAHVIPARRGQRGLAPRARSGAGVPVAACGAVPGVLRATDRAAGRRRRRRRRADRRPHHAAGDVAAGPCATGPRDLAALPAPEPGVLRVLAGDFNATLDHAALRAVLRTGLGGRRAARPAAGCPGPGGRCGCPGRGWCSTTCSSTRGSGSRRSTSRTCPAATTGPSSRTWCCPGALSPMFTGGPGWARPPEETAFDDVRRPEGSTVMLSEREVSAAIGSTAYGSGRRQARHGRGTSSSTTAPARRPGWPSAPACSAPGTRSSRRRTPRSPTAPSALPVTAEAVKSAPHDGRRPPGPRRRGGPAPALRPHGAGGRRRVRRRPRPGPPVPVPDAVRRSDGGRGGGRSDARTDRTRRRRRQPTAVRRRR